jgi:hypothetical protein
MGGPSLAALGSLTFSYPPLAWRAFTFRPCGARGEGMGTKVRP